MKIPNGKYMVGDDTAEVTEKGLFKYTYKTNHAGIGAPVGYWNKKVAVKNYWVKIYPKTNEKTIADNVTSTFKVGTLSSNNSTNFILTSSGLIEVPIIVNDVLKINFILDSGASEVSITPDVALTLVRTGTVTEADWLPGQMYVLADGSTTKSNRFMIRSLNIAGQTINNVPCSISGSIDAPMLLGQNVLNRFGKVIIDYQNRRIAFED